MKVLKKIIPIVFLAACICLGLYMMTPTKALKEKEEFVAAWNHLSNIAKEPHESDSVGIQQVKAYLKEQFEQMEVAYEEEDFTYEGMALTNFLVKFDAPNSEEGVMFVSHYDSVPDGPGACDDGISVASILAAMKELKGRNLKNDLYFLFTDGEEQKSMYGAKHFIREHGKEYQDIVKLVLNFESRGTKGPLLMFETSSGNKNLARLLQKSVQSGSTAFSFAAAVYKTMPNDTDLTEFLEAGYTGMNFAVVGGGENYHSEYDSMEVLDKDTAYMYVSTVRELVLAMTDYDLTTISSVEDGVYFPIWKGRNLVLSITVVRILAIAAGTLFLGLIAWAGQKKKLKGKKIAVSLGIITISVACSAAAVYLIGLLSEKIYGSMEHTVQNVVRIRGYAVLGAVGAAIILTAVLISIFSEYLGNAFERLVIYGLLFFIGTIILYIRYDAFLYLTSFLLLTLDFILGSEVLAMSGKMAGNVLRTVFVYVTGFIMALLFVPVLKVAYDALFILESFRISGYLYGCLAAFLSAVFFLGAAEMTIKKTKKVQRKMYSSRQR